MSTGDSASSLAAEFPTPTRRQWLLGVAGALKLDPAIVDGDDPESALAKLRSTTLDHIEIEPLYSADDETSDAIGLPGFAPFIRGRRAAGARDTNWDVRQLIDASWPTVDAVGELERGATSLWLDLRHTEVIDVDVLDHVLKGVLLDLAPVVLDAGERWEQAAEAFAALCARRDIRPAAGSSIGADPLGEHASRGGSTTPDLGALVHACASADAVRVIVVDATRYNDAGASDGQELAFVVAAAVEYLRALTSGGVDLATSLAHIELRIAATADQFATVAKIRALRRVWARVA
ncbi:MAG TPA: methylmalonyl-CoA mutase family protein, partial [Ilumatobacteraceae bacterium]